MHVHSYVSSKTIYLIEIEIAVNQFHNKDYTIIYEINFTPLYTNPLYWSFTEYGILLQDF